MLTQSEALFEEFCQDNQLTYKKLPSTQPDYELRLGDALIFVEVKQLDQGENVVELKLLSPNAKESTTESLEEASLEEHVKFHLKSATKQLQSGCQNKYPGLLVLYDTRCSS